MKRLVKVLAVIMASWNVVISMLLCIMWYLASIDYPQYMVLNAVAILFYWKYRPVVNVRKEDAKEIINAINKKNNAKRRIEEAIGRDDSSDKAE